MYNQNIDSKKLEIKKESKFLTYVLPIAIGVVLGVNLFFQLIKWVWWNEGSYSTNQGGVATQYYFFFVKK